MDIILSINNNEKVMFLPVPSQPKIKRAVNNQNFSTLNGDITLIGKKGLMDITLISFFPVRDYDFIRPRGTSHAQEYIEFIEDAMNREIPVRLIWLSDLETKLNLAVTVEAFDYEPDQTGDIYYTLKLKEYMIL